jgi:hypothetical protein
MEREMWIGVVLQAANDINIEPYGSVEYGEAVSFFIAPGEWAESRQRIADCIGRHADELMRMGRAAIDRRHLRDGPEPVRVRMVGNRTAVLPTAPAPRLTNPAPVVPLIVSPHRGAPRLHKERRDRQWWIQQFMAKQAA